MASARARRTKRAESPRGDNVDCKRTPGEPVSRAETPDQRVAFAGLKPLIPEDKMYSYKPSVISAALDSVLAKVYPIEARTKIKDSMPTTALVTCKLVHALCASAKLNERGELKGAKASGEWRKEFESALVNALPLREHHRAFLTHNVFVTMIGAVVARALEQATRERATAALQLKSDKKVRADDPEVLELTLDLLADRYYVRNIVCHDSSKTSALEAAAYSGIMALHIEKTQLQKKSGGRAPNPVKDRLVEMHADLGPLTGPMADVGFKHHYENNPHHPEHYGTGNDSRMADMHVVEAVVDGLACVFERQKPADAQAWLGAFFTERFPNGENRAFAEKVISALRTYITPEDYGALKAFRDAVHAIAGESVPWTRVTMTDCCDYKPPGKLDPSANTGLSAYLDHIKD